MTPNSKLPTSAIKKRFSNALMALLTVLLTATVHAETQLNMKWDTRYRPDGTPVPDAEHEIPRLDRAALQAALSRSAMPLTPHPVHVVQDLGYKLTLDGQQFYLQPILFMARSRPDEVCTPVDFNDKPVYRCQEGQRYAVKCHVFIFDSNFREVGFHTVQINETWPYFCNAIPSAGVGDKSRDEILLTVQYFPIDDQPAKKISEIGSSWRRMTVRLRLSEVQGKVNIEQDDSCLGNPNRVVSVPDARRQLRQCAAAALR